MSVMPDASLIQQQLLNQGQANVTIHAFDQLGSTSAWLREHTAQLLDSASLDEAETSKRVHLCVTDWQNAGVGRRGKSWQTKPGNLTLSLLSHSRKPAAELMGLSLVTGIAVAECLADTLGIRPQLKWPNDVLVDGAKLGGLLTELSRAPGDLAGVRGTWLYSGIGINVLYDESVTGLGIGATSIEALGVKASREERDTLVAKIAASVLTEHQRFDESGWSVFAHRWSELDCLLNQEVLIHRENSTEQAMARGVNETGALLVERAGKVVSLFSGDVSIRRPTV